MGEDPARLQGNEALRHAVRVQTAAGREVHGERIAGAGLRKCIKCCILALSSPHRSLRALKLSRMRACICLADQVGGVVMAAGAEATAARGLNTTAVLITETSA